jgi:hypothetical protein
MVDFVIRTAPPRHRDLGILRPMSDFAAKRTTGEPSTAGVRLLRSLASVWLATCIATPTALAAETSEPWTLEVVDQAGCTDRAGFMTAVRARSARIREPAQGEVARGLRVVIAVGADGGYRGELTVIDDHHDGALGRSRSIEGTTCQEVVDSLALFTVLAIDPTAVTGETVEVRTPEPSSPTVHATEPRRDGPRTPAPRRTQRQDGPAVRARATFGINGGFFAAGTPAPLAAGGIFSEIAYRDSGELGVRFGPSARLALTMTTLARVRVTEGSARLRWTNLGLDACPVVLRFTRALSLRPCLGLSAGLLEASGSIAEPRSVVAPFRTVGVLARGEWTLGPSWLLELSGGVARPLRRDLFYFEPSTPVYEPPPFVGIVTIGAGYRFL